MSMKFERRFLKNSLLLSIGVILSRISGFLRDLILANYFGVKGVIEAFFISQRIPNLLRYVLGEGIVNSAIVPVLSRYKDTKDFNKICNSLILVFGSLGIVISFMGSILAPLFVKILAPGFLKNKELFLMTTKLTRITFFYFFFITVFSSFMGILFCLGEFFSSGFSPFIANLVLILGIIFSVKFLKSPIYGIAWFFVFSGLFYPLTQLLFLFKRGFVFNLPKKIFLKPIKEIAKLSFQRLFLFAFWYLNNIIDTIFSSLFWIVGRGAVSAIYYSQRLISLPLGVVGFSFLGAGTAQLSEYVSKEDISKFQDVFSYSLRLLSFLIIPLSFVYILFPDSIIRLLFERGKFTPDSTFFVSWPLIFYSFGLYFFSINYLLNSFFFSHCDLKTPLKISFFSFLLNVVLNLILIFPLRTGGIALSTSLTAFFRFLWYIFIIKKRGVNFKGFFSYVSKITLLSFVIGVLIFYLSKKLNFINCIFLGAIFYIFTSFILGLFPVRYGERKV